jgi:hypothetical protein
VEDTPSLAEAILDQIADPVIFADATGWNKTVEQNGDAAKQNGDAVRRAKV